MYQQQSFSGYFNPQQYKTAPTISMNLKGHPVTSIDEAKATAIDFDGSVFYFPDVANNCIYTKQINMDGTVSLSMYELKEIPVPVKEEDKNYVTRDEFESALAQIKALVAPPEAPPAKEQFNF